jgi:hypothetical protein
MACRLRPSLSGRRARAPQAVHSGADLNASAQAAAGALPAGVKGYLGYVQAHQGDHIILPLVENAVEARTELAAALPGNRRAPSAACSAPRARAGACNKALPGQPVHRLYTWGASSPRATPLTGASPRVATQSTVSLYSLALPAL